jgi:hypothetical protein
MGSSRRWVGAGWAFKMLVRRSRAGGRRRMGVVGRLQVQYKIKVKINAWDSQKKIPPFRAREKWDFR